MFQTAFQTIMPQVSHRQKPILAMYTIFAICGEVGSSYDEHTWKQPATPPAELEKLPAALQALSVCVTNESDRMWRSYLLTARAIGEFFSGNNEGACAALLAAKLCIDESVAANDRDCSDRRRYDGHHGPELAYQYLWLRARLADLFEVAQNWTALEEQLRALLTAAHDKPRGVFNAMFCIDDDGDGHDTYWGGTYELTRPNNPIPCLRRQLAHVCTQLGKHEEAAKLLAH